MRKVKAFEYLNLLLISPNKGEVENNIVFSLDLKNQELLKKLKQYATRLKRVLRVKDIDFLIIPVLLTPTNLEEQISKLRKNFNIPNTLLSQAHKNKLDRDTFSYLSADKVEQQQDLEKTKTNQKIFYPFVLYILAIDLERKYDYETLTKLFLDLTEEQKVALSKIMRSMIKDLFSKEGSNFDIIIYPSFIPITHLDTINNILSKVLSP